MNAIVSEYGRILRTRWRWIIWGVLLALLAATVLLIMRPPLYRSEATLFVRTPGDVSRVVDGGDSYAQARARTYAALANSSSVSARVVADLGLDLKPEILSSRIHATNRPGTALIDISVSAPSTQEAQRTATVLLSEYATTVRSLESVPGSVVPRAELVVVDPPGPAERAVVFGAWKPIVLSIPVLLLCAVVLGAVIGSFAAVFRSSIERSAGSDDSDITEPPDDSDAVTAGAHPVLDETTQRGVHVDTAPTESRTAAYRKARMLTRWRKHQP
jgi:capsular polysaccharide biosynthesis protein